jgi:hypothetical protein
MAYHRTTLRLSPVLLVLLVEEHCRVQKRQNYSFVHLVFIFPDCREYEEDYKILYQIVLRTSAMKLLLTPAYVKF